MQQIQLIKLFISCPSDVKQEVDSIRIIVDEINKTFGRQNSYSLEFLNWSEDTYTQVGEDAQDVINQQLDPHYDILVGLMWQKIGSPTKRDKSGTIEEINRAIANPSKELLIYFKTTPPESLNDLDLVQLGQVQSFKKDLSEKGVLYKEFNSVANFESLFRINITNLISDKLLNASVKDLPTASVLKVDKYEGISAIIREVEQKETDDSLDLDVFELVESILSSFASVTNSLSSMTLTLHDIAEKMNSKTNELNRISNIKDDRLRTQKSQIVVNILASELLDFNRRMESEKQVLTEHYLEIGPRYLQIMQYEQAYQIQSEVDLRQSLLDYRNSVEETTRQSASFLEEILKWPPATSKFNKSKRETELILKDITKIFLDGLVLLDEALEGRSIKNGV